MTGQAPELNQQGPPEVPEWAQTLENIGFDWRNMPPAEQQKEAERFTQSQAAKQQAEAKRLADAPLWQPTAELTSRDMRAFSQFYAEGANSALSSSLKRRKALTPTGTQYLGWAGFDVLSKPGQMVADLVSGAGQLLVDGSSNVFGTPDVAVPKLDVWTLAEGVGLGDAKELRDVYREAVGYYQEENPGQAFVHHAAATASSLIPYLAQTPARVAVTASQKIADATTRVVTLPNLIVHGGKGAQALLGGLSSWAARSAIRLGAGAKAIEKMGGKAALQAQARNGTLLSFVARQHGWSKGTQQLARAMEVSAKAINQMVGLSVGLGMEQFLRQTQPIYEDGKPVGETMRPTIEDRWTAAQFAGMHAPGIWAAGKLGQAVQTWKLRRAGRAQGYEASDEILAAIRTGEFNKLSMGAARLMGSSVEGMGFQLFNADQRKDLMLSLGGDGEAAKRFAAGYIGTVAGLLGARYRWPADTHLIEGWRRSHPDDNSLPMHMQARTLGRAIAAAFRGEKPTEAREPGQDPMDPLDWNTRPLFRSGWGVDPAAKEGDGKYRMVVDGEPSVFVDIEHVPMVGVAPQNQIKVTVPGKVWRRVRAMTDPNMEVGRDEGAKIEKVTMTGDSAAEFIANLSLVSVGVRLGAARHFDSIGMKEVGAGTGIYTDAEGVWFYRVTMDGVVQKRPVYGPERWTRTGERLRGDELRGAGGEKTLTPEQDMSLRQWSLLLRVMQENSDNPYGPEHLVLMHSLQMAMHGDSGNPSVAALRDLLTNIDPRAALAEMTPDRLKALAFHLGNLGAGLDNAEHALEFMVSRGVIGARPKAEKTGPTLALPPGKESTPTGDQINVEQQAQQSRDRDSARETQQASARVREDAKLRAEKAAEGTKGDEVVVGGDRAGEEQAKREAASDMALDILTTPEGPKLLPPPTKGARSMGAPRKAPVENDVAGLYPELTTRVTIQETIAPDAAVSAVTGDRMSKRRLAAQRKLDLAAEGTKGKDVREAGRSAEEVLDELAASLDPSTDVRSRVNEVIDRANRVIRGETTREAANEGLSTVEREALDELAGSTGIPEARSQEAGRGVLQRGVSKLAEIAGRRDWSKTKRTKEDQAARKEAVIEFLNAAKEAGIEVTSKDLEAAFGMSRTTAARLMKQAKAPGAMKEGSKDFGARVQRAMSNIAKRAAERRKLIRQELELEEGRFDPADPAGPMGKESGSTSLHSEVIKAITRGLDLAKAHIEDFAHMAIQVFGEAGVKGVTFTRWMRDMAIEARRSYMMDSRFVDMTQSVRDREAMRKVYEAVKKAVNVKETPPGRLGKAPFERRKLAKILEAVEALAATGREFRRWYARSGRLLAQSAGWNPERTRAYMGVFAVLSPQADVRHNTRKGWQAIQEMQAQLDAGEPITVPATRGSDTFDPDSPAWHTRVQMEKARRIMMGEDPLSVLNGPKETAFYTNMMEATYPGSMREDATMDLWMGRAYEFPERVYYNAKGEKKTALQMNQSNYNWARNRTREIAEKLGMTPQEAQAAIWVAKKALDEGTSLETAGKDFASWSKELLETIAPTERWQVNVTSFAADRLPGYATVMKAAGEAHKAGDALKAQRLMNGVTERLQEMFEEMFEPLRARIDVEPVLGVFGGTVEPSIRLSIVADMAQADHVLYRSIHAAEAFRQEQVHVVKDIPQGDEVEFGPTAPDRQTVPSARIDLLRPIKSQELDADLQSVGLYGASVTDGGRGLELYHVFGSEASSHAERQQQASDFLQRVTRLEQALHARGVLGHGQRARAGAVDLRVFGDGGTSYADGKGELLARSPEVDFRPDPSLPRSNRALRRELELTLSAATGRDVELPDDLIFTRTKNGTAFQRGVADNYEALPMRDDSPIVRKAYDKLVDMLKEQWGTFAVKVSFMPSDGQGGFRDVYGADSRKMMEDIRVNNRVFIYPTTEGTFGPPGDKNAEAHPLFQMSPAKTTDGEPMRWNDVLRAVHDVYAHAVYGSHFGENGEEVAFAAHAAVGLAHGADPLAIWALATETRGQNSWVNFGPQVRGASGAVLPASKKPSRSELQYAEQKTALLPMEDLRTGLSEVDAAVDKLEADYPGEVSGSLKGETVAAKPPTDGLALKRHRETHPRAAEAGGADARVLGMLAAGAVAGLAVGGGSVAAPIIGAGVGAAVGAARVSKWFRNTKASAKAKDSALEMYGDHWASKLSSQVFAREAKDATTDKEREDISFYLEKTGNPNVGKDDTPEAIWERLSDEGRALAKGIQQKFSHWHDVLTSLAKADIIDPVGFISNYLPHIWKTDNIKIREALRAQLSGKSLHWQKRQVPTLSLGLKLGLKPRTLDVVDILMAYERSVSGAVAVARWLKRLQTVEIPGEPGRFFAEPQKTAPDTYVHAPLQEFPFLRGFKLHPALLGQERQIDIPLLRNLPSTGNVMSAALQLGRRAPTSGVWNTFTTLNSVWKALNLSFSLFHPGALGESGTVAKGGVSLKRVPFYTNIQHGLKLLKTEVALDFARHGLAMEVPHDAVGSDTISRFLHNVETSGGYIGRRVTGAVTGGIAGGAMAGPVGAAVGAAVGTVFGGKKLWEANQKFLWEYVHQGQKVWAADMLLNDSMKRAAKRGVELNADQLRELKRSVMSTVNDMFGGQKWETMFRTSGLQPLMKIALLAPDWTVSNMRIAVRDAAAVARGIPGVRQLAASEEGRAVTDPLLDPSLRRSALMTALMVSVGAAMTQGILSQLLWTEEDREQLAKEGKSVWPWDNDPEKGFGTGYVRSGRDEEGKWTYFRTMKQANEPIMWVTNPMEELGRKLSPMIRVAMEQLTLHTTSGFRVGWQNDPDKDPEVDERMLGLLQSIAPFSLASHGQFLLMFPQSQGMTFYKANALASHALMEYAEGKTNDLGRWDEILHSTRINGMDDVVVAKTSAQKAVSEYQKLMAERLDAGDMRGADRAARAANRLLGTPETAHRGIEMRIERLRAAGEPQLNVMPSQAADLMRAQGDPEMAVYDAIASRIPDDAEPRVWAESAAARRGAGYQRLITTHANDLADRIRERDSKALRSEALEYAREWASRWDLVGGAFATSQRQLDVLNRKSDAQRIRYIQGRLIKSAQSRFLAGINAANELQTIGR